jgi:Na+-driven multidrug efflux pump
MNFDSLRAARRTWIAGIAIALIGVLLTRVLASHFENQPRLILTVAGRILGIVGLVVIAFGINRRLAAAQKDDQP